jgi:hypothetical protein
MHDFDLSNIHDNSILKAYLLGHLSSTGPRLLGILFILAKADRAQIVNRVRIRPLPAMT